MPKSRFKANRPNQKGRSELTERFVGMPHRMLLSSAYRALTPNARALLIELGMLFNGSNNGSLYLGVRDAAALMGISDTKTTKAAFDDLKDLGFIVMTQDAHFSVKAADASRARCWRLTWKPCPGKGTTNEYLSREPQPTTKARRRMERANKVLKARRQKQSQQKYPVVDYRTMTDTGDVS